ncbi:MAG: extracellular solute-binding protein [Actinomycetota bacterium]|nr:extracellular solute-binding protein [Actinomycetota bacterium]
MRSQSTPRLRWLLVALVGSLVLAACAPTAGPEGTTGETTPAGPGEEKSVEPAAEAAEVVKLVAWTIGPDDPSFHRRDNLLLAAEQLNEDLAAEGSNTQVELEATFGGSGTDWGDYKQRFVLAAQADQAPDIVFSTFTDIAPWSEAGYIRPLGDLINPEEEPFSNIFPNLWEAMEYQGELWGIPQDVEARPWFYRADHLRELGWSQEEIDALPQRVLDGDFLMSDILDLAAQAQEQGLVEPGNGLWFRPVNGVDWYINYFNFGGVAQDEEGNLVLDTEAFRQELDLYHQAVSERNVTSPDFLGQEWQAWQTAWVNGEVFTVPAGVWFWAEWTDVYEQPVEELQENIAYTLYPAAEEGGDPITLSQPAAYMISSDSENPELAAEILARASTIPMNIRHAVESAHLTIMQEGAEQPEYQQNEFLTDVTYMLEHTTFLPLHLDFGAYDTALWQARSAVLAGQLEPEQGVEAAVSQLEATVPNVVITGE